jgi:hypothetical protein
MTSAATDHRQQTSPGVNLDVYAHNDHRDDCTSADHNDEHSIDYYSDVTSVANVAYCDSDFNEGGSGDYYSYDYDILN